VAIDDIPTAV